MLLYTTLNSENVSHYTMDWSGTYMTRTGFSFDGNSLYPPETEEWSWGWRDRYKASATKNVRPGFLYAGGNLILETAKIQHVEEGYDAWLVGSNLGRVRCVRDVAE